MAQHTAQIFGVFPSGENLKNHIDLLDKYVREATNENNIEIKANKYKEIITSEMKKLRENADNLEMIVEKKMWPCPSYGDLLFELEN
jgi:glutamine synthetase